MSATLHRWSRRLGLVATGVLTLVVAVLALLQLPPVATWVARHLIPLLPLNPGYRLEVGRVSGDWIHGLEFQDVRLLHRGRELARAERLELGYDPRRLTGETTRLEELVLEHAVLRAHREGGRWDLANALHRSTDTSAAGPSRAFAVDRVALRGIQLAAQFSPDSVLRVRSMTLLGRGLRLGEHVLLTIQELTGAVSPPGTARFFSVATRGTLTREAVRLDPIRVQTEETDVAASVVLPYDLAEPGQADRLRLVVRAHPLAMADLAAVVPAVTPRGELRLDATARGEGRLIVAHLAARLGGATVRLGGDVTLERGRPVRYRARGEVARLDPAGWLRAAPAGDLNGALTADVRGATLRESSGELAVRLSGSRVGARALRRLDFRAELDSGRADVALSGAVGESSLRATGWIRPFESAPSYRLAGNALRLPGTDALVRALAGSDGSPSLDARFRIAGAGLSPRAAHASGGVQLAAVRRDGSRTPLGRSSFAVAAGRIEARPELLAGGGRISALATARLGDPLRYRIRRGAIAGVDLGGMLGDTVSAPVNGRFSLTGRGTAPAAAVVRARVELDSLRYGTRRLDGLAATLRLAGGTARADLHATLQGGSVALDARARPFDSIPSFAVRRATLDSVDLGALLGQPRLAGPVSLVARASGTWSAGARGGGASRALEGDLTLLPSRVGGVAVGGGTLEWRFRGGRLTYAASVTSSAGALAVSGDGRPESPTPAFTVRRGRADSLDLAMLLGRPALATTLNARFTASAEGASLDSLAGRLAVTLLPSRVREAELREGRVTLALRRGTLQGEARFDGPDGTLAAKLTGSATGGRTRVGADGTLRLEHLARWTGRADADGRFESRFALDAAADSAGLLAVGGTLTGSGGIGGVRLDPLHLALAPDTGAIRLDTLIVRSNVALLGGSGRLPLREPRSGGAPVGAPADSLGPPANTVRIAGQLNDPAPLAALIGAPTVSLDSGRVAVTVSGPVADRRVEGDLDVHGFFVAGNLAERVTVHAGGELAGGARAFTANLRLRNGAFGRIRVPRAEVRGRYDSTFALAGTATLNDSVPVAAALTGVAGDTVRAEIERLDLGGWSLARPAVVSVRPRIEARDLRLVGPDRMIAVNGVVDRTGTSDLTVQLARVDLDLLRELGLSPVPGRVDGRVRLSGPADAPHLTGTLGLTVRSREGTELGVIRTGVDWTRAGLRLDATAAPAQGGTLTLDGTLPVRLTLAPGGGRAARVGTDSVRLAMRADAFELALFDPLLPPESARDLRGRLALAGRIGGTLDDPTAQGSFALDSAAFTLPALGVSYTGALAGSLSDDRLRVDRLRLATDEDQTLTADGTVLLRPLDDPRLDLDARLSDFRVSDSDQLKSIASGSVHLGGTLQAPELTGRLQLGPTEVFTGAGAAAAQLEQVELTAADLRRVARQFGPTAIRQAHEGPGLTQRVRLALDLSFPNRVWLRRRAAPSMDIELFGRMQLRQEPGGAMRFFGTVEPVAGRSTLDVAGREFRLTGGTVRLNGPADAAHLDVTAEYRVPTQGRPDEEGVIVEVSAVGRPDSLELSFTADPAMSQEDILSYIVTGRPASDNPLASSQGTSGAALGERIALGQVSQIFSNRVGEELGFDVFQIRQQPLTGLTLTAGRYLASRLFAELTLPLQISEDARAPGARLGPGFELDYLARRWLSAGVRGGSLPAGFSFRGHHAY